MKSDWVMYFSITDYEKLISAVRNDSLIELENLFGGREVVDGSDVSTFHVSSVESRAKYEKFSQMLTDEEETTTKKEWEE